MYMNMYNSYIYIKYIYIFFLSAEKVYYEICHIENSKILKFRIDCHKTIEDLNFQKHSI